MDAALVPETERGWARIYVKLLIEPVTSWAADDMSVALFYIKNPRQKLTRVVIDNNLKDWEQFDVSYVPNVKQSHEEMFHTYCNTATWRQAELQGFDNPFIDALILAFLAVSQLLFHAPF